MPKSLTKEEAYQKCESGGMFLPQSEIDARKIKSMLQMVEEDLKTIDELKNKNDRFNTIYKLSYDVLHTLTEAVLMFDKVKSMNHQCLFAYLCCQHPELELDWDFFEKIRTKRNGIHYYGSSIERQDWKEINVQAMVYISTLRKVVMEKWAKL